MITTTHNSTQQQSKFKETAVQIGRYLAREAVWDEDRCNWIGHAVESVGQQYQMVRRSFSRDFYNGTSGIAFFLAQLLRFQDDPILEETLEGCMNQVLYLDEHTDRMSSNFGFHGGRIGIAFAIIEVGKLRQEQPWIDAGHKLLEQICQSEIQDYELDIISGVAGGMPVLLHYYRESGQLLYLDTATRCGDFLLNKVQKQDNQWSWKTPLSSHALTGYSHGNAGIALALLELYAVTQDPGLYTAAMYGFNYERLLFNPGVQNWPDLRELNPGIPNANGPSYTESWCHGAPGIALSRLRAWELTGDNSFRQEAEAALNTTYKGVHAQLTRQPDLANFSLCHGMAGNADILLEGAHCLQYPAYRQLAEQVGGIGIHKYAETGLNWPSGVNDPSGLTRGMNETPGFMLGLAGTGYFYLRLAFPEQVESRLLL